jgi:pimeloyl-ACP methyl ester carboxylesterase
LVLSGHGFMLDKTQPFPLATVRAFASEHGCVVAILDAPEHGERGPDEPEAVARAYREKWRRDLGRGVAAEHRALVEALQAEELASEAVAWWGLSLATQYGLAFLAGNESVRAAVLGLFGAGPVVSHYAQRVRCPTFFIQQLADEVHSPDDVRALYDAIGASDKQLAASDGLHIEIPNSVLARAARFLLDRLLDR